MKIPKDIVTRHKIRDSKILSLYVNGTWTHEAIGKRFGISQVRVGQIIYKNRHLLKLDRDYEKIQRITHLKRILVKKSDRCVTKDAVDLLDKLRVETEGNNPEKGTQSGETRVIIIKESANGSGNQNQSRTVSGSVSVVRI